MGVRWSRMSWSDRNELWARWRRGESVRQISAWTAARIERYPHRRRSRRRHYAPSASAVPIGSDPRGARRHFPAAGVRPIVADDQSDARPSGVHTEPRSGAYRRARRLSSRRRRQTSLAPHSSAPAVSSIDPSRAAANRGAHTRAAVVAAADLGLASMPLSE